MRPRAETVRAATKIAARTGRNELEGVHDSLPTAANDANLNEADDQDDESEQPAHGRARAEVAVGESVLIKITDDGQAAVAGAISAAIVLQKVVGQFEKLVGADGAGDDDESRYRGDGGDGDIPEDAGSGPAPSILAASIRL